MFTNFGILEQTKFTVTTKAPNQYRGKHHVSFMSSVFVYPHLSTLRVGDRAKNHMIFKDTFMIYNIILLRF